MNKMRLIAILILVCTLAAVILQNRSPVQAHFLLITVEMPVILLLLLTAGLGFALGLLAALFHNSGGKQQDNDHKEPRP
ncbi:MAG TPA: hypothetical protein DDY20_04375 [Desulfobulbaceae bacterium]|nr:hypothetical protein [Desulfobulbaceae bacterium]